MKVTIRKHEITQVAGIAAAQADGATRVGSSPGMGACRWSSPGLGCHCWPAPGSYSCRLAWALLFAVDDGFCQAWRAAMRWHAVKKWHERWRSVKQQAGAHCPAGCDLWAVLTSVLPQNMLKVQSASAHAQAVQMSLKDHRQKRRAAPQLKLLSYGSLMTRISYCFWLVNLLKVEKKWFHFKNISRDE